MPWTQAGTSRPRVLVVGYAGGTLARVAKAVAPKGREPDVLGVELDPEVPPLALARLDPSGRLDPAATVRTGEDGRTAIASLPEAERFDLVAIDAYQRTQYVPFQLATVEFFRECVRRTTPTGAVAINVLAPGALRSRLLSTLATTLETALAQEGGGSVWALANPYYDENVALWGIRGARPPRVGAGVPGPLAAPAAAFDRLLLRHHPRPGDVAFTDDRAPTEALADDAIRGDAP
jgi:spermidine synthase